VSSPILWYRMGTITQFTSHTCICNVLLKIIEYRRSAAIHINRRGTNNTKQLKKKRHVTRFWTKSGPRVHIEEVFAQQHYVILTSRQILFHVSILMNYLPKNSMVFHCSTQSFNDYCPFTLIFAFVEYLCLLDPFYLASHPVRLQNSVQCYEFSQTDSFQYVSILKCTNCSHIQIYVVIFFTDFLLIFSYCIPHQHTCIL